MSDPTLPQTKEELMSQIRAEWMALMDVIARLSAEQFVTPDPGGWSPKDNLAHLAEWMKILMGYHMDKRPAHEVTRLAPEVTANWDMEEINPVLFERNRDRPAAEVVEELKSVYTQLYARLDALSFEDLMKPRHEDDPEKRPLLLWVLGDTTDHFAEHRATIEKTM
jgi:hypothetical protein